MIGIYEVYIDVFLVQNILTDMQLLSLTLLLLKEKIVFPRLLCASLAGGAGAVLVLVSGIGFGVPYIVLILALDAEMLLICIRRPGRRRIPFQKLAMGLIYLHGMAFAYGKLLECADRLAGKQWAQLLAAALIACIVSFILAGHRLAAAKQIYEVTLIEGGENAVYKALFDTGNLLTDPVSGKPVSVVEETDLTKEWLERYPQKYKIIPYRSVGKSHGVMEGIVVDEMVIQKEREQVVKKGVVVALYKGKLSKDGAFQMILNHSLMI